MKLKYFLLALLSMTLLHVNAQFTDDMESYTDGSPIYGGHWVDWGCGGSCALLSSSAQAHDGTLSGLIPGDNSTDPVLDLGNKIFGQWGLGFYAYIPSGKEAYYNLQGTVPIGSGEWIVGNIFFNQDTASPGVGLIDNCVGAPVNFNFPHDEWFYIAMNVDISAGIGAATWEYWVNGVEVIPAGTAFTDNSGTIPSSLGGLNFFSISADNMMWLDTFVYQEGFVPTSSGEVNLITGNILFDMDSNGCAAGDILADNIMVTTTNGINTYTTSTNSNGDYSFYVGLGNYTTSVSVNNDLFSVSPLSQSSTFTDYGNTDFIDFCLTIDVLADDVNVVLIPTSDARPGFDAQYQIVYNNSGSTTTNGDITLVFDDSKLVFLDADIPPDVINNNTLTWNYNNLLPFETRVINLNFNVFPPPQVEINDILMFTTSITPLVTDINDIDNTHEFNQIVIGSYDPNDKTVLEGDRLRIENIDNYLHYLVRFQNTGTASAINVLVEDILDDKLDWSTFTPIEYSHSAQLEISNENNLQFIFNNINLPDSTSNEPESHGHILFKVKPKPNVVVGDIISGSASIFFDFNPPVITNTVITEIVDNEAPIANDDTLVIAEGNTGTVDVASNDIDVDGTLDVSSIQITSPPLYGNLTNNGDGTFGYIHDGTQNPQDYFRYTINDNEGVTSNVAVVSITIQSILGLNDFTIEKFEIYPNPASTEIHIEVGDNTFPKKLEIFDMNGRLLSKNVPSKNSQIHHLDISKLSSGMYFIAMTNQEGQRIIRKMVKE